jgi:outer membrane protein assembly factor BamB
MRVIEKSNIASRAGAIALIVGLAGVSCSCLAKASPPNEPSMWPTLHKDYQRSGYTGEVVKGPYERKWYRDFHGEMIATRVEAIVAEGKCFVGTFAGSLYALDVKDGHTVWEFHAEGPIGHSPCYDGGKLYFGADEGFNKGTLYCVAAEDGNLVWKYDAGAGIWVSLACDGEKLYFGDRAGIFHAVHVANGEQAWTFKTGNMILTPASFTRDGQKIVFGSEDMHVYCLDPSGTLLWRSKKLHGLSLRDHAPTIWKGLSIVRTNPADGFHTVLDRNGGLLNRVQQGIPIGPEDKVLFDNWGDVMMKETPDRRKAEQEAVVKYLKENPHDRTFYALRLEDGREPWVSQVLYTGGLHNPPTPPTFHPKTGELYVYYRTALTNYLRGVRRYSALGRLNRETGLIDFSYPEFEHPKQDWYGFPMIGDETQSLSLMDNLLLGTHQGELARLDLETMRVTHIWRGRDTYGGIFGPAAVRDGFEGAREFAAKGYLTGMPNEWHGPDRSILAIAEGRMFWVVGSQVVCIAGPDVPRRESGGTKPPPTLRSKLTLVPGGNVARGIGRYDDAVSKRRISAGELEWLLSSVPSARVKQSTAPLAQELRAALDAEVIELVDGGPWAPFVVELGISNERKYFWRTAETMQTLSLALPHLSPPVQAKARLYLDSMFSSGMPLESPVHSDDKGKRREYYDLGPGMRAYAGRRSTYGANVEDLYAVWAYAHYASAWDGVLTHSDEIQRIFASFADRPLEFNHNDQRNDSAEHLNGQIAGTLAFIRIMRRLNEDKALPKAMAVLADLVTERVHHERADSRLVRQSGSAHSAKVPRYVGLVPDTCLALGRYAGNQFEHFVRGLAKQLPVWYQAFGERMIGGENYISPPDLSRGFLAALADGVQVPPEDLAKFLDRPWCHADLYYIEKLSAVLRRLDGEE